MAEGTGPKRIYKTGILFEEDQEIEAAAEAEQLERTAKIRRRQEHLVAKKRARLLKLRLWGLGGVLVVAATLAALGWAGVWPFAWRVPPPTPQQAQETAQRWVAYAVEQVEQFRKAHNALPTALSQVDVGPPDVFLYYTLPDNTYRITVRYHGQTATFDSTQDAAKLIRDARKRAKGGKS